MSNEIDEKEESNVLALASLGAIIGFVIPLIMWIAKKNTFSDYTKNFLTDVLNFEILIFAVYVALNFIPFFGGLISMLAFLLNLVIALKCYNATKVREEYYFPFNVKIVQ